MMFTGGRPFHHMKSWNMAHAFIDLCVFGLGLAPDLPMSNGVVVWNVDPDHVKPAQRGVDERRKARVISSIGSFAGVRGNPSSAEK